MQRFTRYPTVLLFIACGGLIFMGDQQIASAQSTNAPDPQQAAQTTLNSLQGDWTGSLGGTLPLVFHFKSNGTGSLDSPKQGGYGIVLQYTASGAQVSVTIPSIGATYIATVGGNQMGGTFAQNGQNIPLTVSQSATAPPSTSAQSKKSGGIQGDWTGTLVGALPLIFHLGSDGSGTADSPSQKALGMPLQYTATGSQVKITIASVHATYSATVSAGQMSGTFSQNGQDIPLSLTRSGTTSEASSSSGDGGSGSVQGDWLGTLQGTLPLVFHLGANGAGTADSPNQSAYGMVLQYSTESTKISIKIPSIGAKYAGTIGGTQIGGTFSQNGQDIPLTLTLNISN